MEGDSKSPRDASSNCDSPYSDICPFFFGGYVFPELQSELSLQEETRPYDSAFSFSCCDRSTECVTAIIAA